MTKYGKLTAVLIAVWFLFALTASAFHLIRTGPNQPPIFLGLAALLPIVLFLLWFRVSPGFRQFSLTLNPRVLAWVHTLRLEGMVFLVLATYGILPRLFALSAGWGDITIGATALLVGAVLATPNHRNTFIIWNLLGMADLVSAVSLGALSTVIDPHGITTVAMTELPMSLIPTFGVPLFMMIHIICIAQALRWPARRYAPIAQQMPSHSA